MRTIFNKPGLILVPETEDESRELAIWKTSHTSHFFVVRPTKGNGVMLRDEGHRKDVATATPTAAPVPLAEATAPSASADAVTGPPIVPEDNRVLFYKRDRAVFGFCSNFHPASISLDGQDWPTTEHYYQYHRSPDRQYRQAIRAAVTPGQAKRLAAAPDAHGYSGRDSWFRKNQATPRPDWEAVKLDIMRTAIRAKFTQNAELARMLLATGNAELVEDSKSDSFWGIGDGSGTNWLGRLLMELRGELRSIS